MNIFDPDKGLSGFVIHHEPLKPIQLKRLLLIFDQLCISPPEDQVYFLKEGAICYHYDRVGNIVKLLSLDGFQMIERFKDSPKPNIANDQLVAASVLNYGGSIDGKEKPYQAILIGDILPFYKGQEYKKEEEELLDRFEKAIEKNNLKILDHTKTNFYQQNSISLKIAYDYDVSDYNAGNYIKDLFRKEGRNEINMFFPSPPLPEFGGINIFPKPNYNRFFINSKEEQENDFERQYLSILGKVIKKLAISSQYNMMPIFINPHIYNYYQYKVSKAKNNNDKNFINEWKENYNHPLMNLNNLIIQSSYLYISDRVLDDLTIPQILSYKERSIDELYRLRLELSKEIGNLASISAKDLALKEFQDFINRKLSPDFIAYQKSQNDLLSKVINKTIKYSVGVGAAYFGSVQGLSPLLIAILSGISPNLADDALALSNKLREKRRKNYENTFSYYLNLSKSIVK